MKTGKGHELKRNTRLNRGVREGIDIEVHFPGEGGLMRCHRCNGIMIYEKFYGDCEHFFGWRCVVCGEIVDQVILENRLESVR